MRLEPRERITEIRFNEQDDTAAVYTHSTYLRGKIEKLAHDRPEQCRIIEYVNEGRGVRCIVPRGWIRINPSYRLTDEQRRAKADRLRQYHQNR